MIHDLDKIQAALRAILGKLNTILCNTSTVLLGTTELDPPVDAPAAAGPTVLINLTTGGMWYWDGDSWEALGGGGGFFASSTNSPSTPVAQDANFSVYDINNLDQFNINGGVGGQIILTLEGISGDSRVSATDGLASITYDGDDATYSSVIASQGTLLLEAGDTIDDSSINMGTAGILLYSNLGVYAIDGLPTYADDTAAGAGGLAAGRLYKTATGVMMVKL